MAKTDLTQAKARLDRFKELDKEFRARYESARKYVDDYVIAGQVMAEIHHEKLWKVAGFNTFEEYLATHEGFGLRRAQHLIKAAKDRKKLEALDANHGSFNGPSDPKNAGPTNERQSRELAKAPKDKRAAVWKKAVASAPDGKPTAKQVKAAVDAVKPKERVPGGSMPVLRREGL